MKRKWTVALAAALLAVLLCAVALAAVGRWGMLDFIGRYQHAYIPQDAGDYVQSDVAAFAQDGLAVNVRELYYDCDEDCLLCKVDPEGPACHTGAHSCFYRQIPLGEPESAEGTGPPRANTVEQSLNAGAAGARTV